MHAFCQNLIQAQKIYLSPAGNDNNPGTIDRPLASLSKAHERSLELRKVNSGTEPIEVIAIGGEYQMREPLFLTNQDSGTPSAPLIFKAEEGSIAVFTGGVRIQGFEEWIQIMESIYPEVARYGWYLSSFCKWQEGSKGQNTQWRILLY